MLGRTVYILEHGGGSVRPYIINRKILYITVHHKNGVRYHYKDGCFSEAALCRYVFFDYSAAVAKRNYYWKVGWRELRDEIHKTKN